MIFNFNLLIFNVCLFAELCTENADVQAEIIDQHNIFRRAVQPPATNMLKMVRSLSNHTIEAEMFCTEALHH